MHSEDSKSHFWSKDCCRPLGLRNAAEEQRAGDVDGREDDSGDSTSLGCVFESTANKGRSNSGEGNTSGFAVVVAFDM
jgi:hypothetical protein